MLYTLNYEIERQYLKEKMKKTIGLMKAELGAKTMSEFATLRSKAYSYLADDNNEN